MTPEQLQQVAALATVFEAFPDEWEATGPPYQYRDLAAALRALLSERDAMLDELRRRNAHSYRCALHHGQQLGCNCWLRDAALSSGKGHDDPA